MDYFALGNRNAVHYMNCTIDPAFYFVAPIFLKYDINREGCTVPIIMSRMVSHFLRNEHTPKKAVSPLTVNLTNRTFSGGDTLLRWAAREYPNTIARLCKMQTSKGEIYYGGSGILFDKDFVPLLLSTVTLEGSRGVQREIIIHISPKTFLEKSTLNTTITKRVLPYFLENNTSGSWNVAPIKIVIDNSESFIHKVNKPNLEKSVIEDANVILRENIDEIITQIAIDSLNGRLNF